MDKTQSCLTDAPLSMYWMYSMTAQCKYVSILNCAGKLNYTPSGSCTFFKTCVHMRDGICCITPSCGDTAHTVVGLK